MTIKLILESLFLTLLLACLITLNSATESLNTSAVLNDIQKNDLELLESWKNMLDGAKSGIQSVMKNALPTFVRLTSKATLSPECQGSFLSLFIGLGSLKKWAITMLDASGKIPPGLTRGTLADLGDFDLCLDTKIKEKTKWSDKVTGMYCSAIFTPKLPKTRQLDFVNLTGPDTIFASFQDKVRFMPQMKFRTGLCVPSSCSSKDIQSLLSSVIDGSPMQVKVPECEVKRDNEFTWYQIAILSCFSLLLALLILATAIDLTLPISIKNAGVFSFSQHFSLYANGKKFLNTEIKSKQLGVLSGLKVLTIFWIILDHTYTKLFLIALNRSMNILEHLKDPLLGLILNGYGAVDTFFVVSGVLLSYLSMRLMEKSGGRFNVGLFCLNRFLRLAPSLLFLLGMLMLFPLMGSGPLFREIVTFEIDICKRNWWSTLTFINGWFKMEDVCLAHTWFLSADMHFCILSAFLLIIFYRSPRSGILIISAVVLGSISLTAFLNWYNNFYVFFPINLDELLIYKSSVEMCYFKPYSHLETYFLGFLFGYIFYKRSEMHLKPVYVFLGWTLSTAFPLSILMGVYPWFNGTVPSLTEIIAYRSLYRIGWALSINWIIFASYYGYGGFVNTVLSWKLFVPLNRLVYMIYLTHFPIQWLRYGTLKHTIPLEHIEEIYEFFGNLVVTLLVSVVCHLAVEAPFVSLSTAFFKSLGKKDAIPITNTVLVKVTTNKGISDIKLDEKKGVPIQILNITSLVNRT